MIQPPCNGCPGLCCRNLGITAEMLESLPESVAEAFRNFPHPIVDGCCSKLGPDGKCTVYDSRPVLCNWAASWLAFEGELPFENEHEFRKWNRDQCFHLQHAHRSKT